MSVFAGGLGGIRHFPGLGGADGVGFFGEDVFPGLQGGDRNFAVKEIGGADINGIHILQGEQVAIVGEDMRDLVLFGERLGTLGLDVADGDDLDVGVFQERLGVDGFEYCANADGAQANF